MRTLIAAALAGLAAAHPTFDAQEFVATGRAASDATVTFTAAIPVPAAKAIALDHTLNVIADPDSNLYGKWLSHDEVLNYMAPEPAHREAVREWVTSTGAKCIDWPSALRCSASVLQVEKLLQTEMTSYQHTARDNKLVHRIAPGTSFTVPKELEGKLAFMTSLVDFPTVRMRMGRTGSVEERQERGRGLQATWDPSVVMETLNSLYGLPSQDKTTNGAATSAPAEFQGDTSWALSDIDVFSQQNAVAAWNASNIVGPFTPSSPDTEATLDVQYMGGVSDGNPQWYWTEADWMYEWIQHMAATPSAQLPKVFSVSWGWSEANQCYVDTTGGACTTSNSTAYVQQTNVGFAAASARGISILVSSGDSGAHGRTDSGCSSPMTLPDFPTSSPYITAVGATQLINPTPLNPATTPFCKNATAAGNPACAAGGTEIVCSTATGALIVSGGGFSNVAATPVWQQAAVAKYLASGVVFPGAGNFNPAGRAYPDVAALGHNYYIVIGGSDEAVDGTSCSAPVWGGVVSNLNAIRMAAGKPALGFLNPLLYKLGATGGYFTDVVTGNNTCTEQGCVPGCTGFNAAPGYDATTGFGTPIFPRLANAVSALN